VRTSQMGRGIATAAARLVARFGLETLSMQRLEIVAAEGNTASQRVANDCALVFRIVRFARLMAERVVDECRARRIDGLRDVVCRSHAQGRDSGGLDFAGNQSNGLMAHGSSGHQVKCFHVAAAKFFDDFRRQFLAHLARRVDPTHESERRIA